MKAIAKRSINAVDRLIARNLLKNLNDINIHINLWDIETIKLSDTLCEYLLKITDRKALYFLILYPDFAFGELFTTNRIELTGELDKFLYKCFSQKNKNSLLKGIQLLALKFQSNTIKKARKNVVNHYDLGNDFFKYWLDPTMTYTCAYFPNDDITLEEAQLEKMEYICKKLNLTKGLTVIEAGCGWGGLAIYMAKNYGVNVTAYNISKEQINYAKISAAEQGLSDLVEFVEDDYRNIVGVFDRFVSIGMLEHVGKNNFQSVTKLISKVLKPDGIGLIHSIGTLKARPTNSWLNKKIFPGSYMPPLSEIVKIIETADYAVLDVENLRFHYQKTLKQWLANFEEKSQVILQMKGVVFYKMWKLYLVGSMVSFEVGNHHLFQVLFSPKSNINWPSNRSYLYLPNLPPEFNCITGP